jgi:uncharacterized protein (TIGR03435 family)
MTSRALAGLIIVSCGLAYGQTAFEVASIRTGAPFSMALLRSGGVGMKTDGARVIIRTWTPADLIGAAYQVRTDQITGPDWIGADRWDIQANMPQGTSSTQVPEMLRTLLAERFKLAARRTQKMMPVYALMAGKGGPALQASTSDDSTPSGCTPAGGNHRVCRRMTMGDLANMLTQLSRMNAAMPPGAMTWGIEMPAVDMTGLKGAWDFSMDFGPAGADGEAASVIDAVEKLGLKLDPQKRPYENIVIDRLEKLPTEN